MKTRDFKPAPIDFLQHHEVLQNLIDTKPGDHICVLYDYSPLEQIGQVAAYLKEGIAAGEQCIYVADDINGEHLIAALRSAGIDVDSARDNNSMLIWTRERWREPGALDTVRKAAQVRQLVEAALNAGFAGVRFAVEMTWTLRPDLDPSEIEAWELHSNTLLQPGAPVRALCLYGRQRLPSQTLVAGMRTHPSVLEKRAAHNADGQTAPRDSQR